MLYGQGSPGGLIDLTTKRPTAQPFAEALVRLGLRCNLEGAFDIGGPINADRSLLYRVVGVGRLGDGPVDFSKNERIYFAPSFTAHFNENTSLTLLAHYQYDPNLTVLQPLPYAGSVVPDANGRLISRRLFLGEPGYHNTNKEAYRLGYEFKHRFNDVFSFQQNLAYQKIDISLQEVQSRAALVGGDSVVRQMSNQRYIIDLFQIDNRFRADFTTGPLKHHVMFGVDYSMAPNYQGTGQNRASNYLLNLFNPVYGQVLGANPITSRRYQDQEQVGFYAQDRIEIGQLSMLFGARRDRAFFGQHTQTISAATGLPVSTTPRAEKLDTAVTYNAGAIYAFSNGVAPFVNYSESFAPTTGSDFSGRPFIPTTGEQIEGGVKYLLPGLNLLATAAVFEIVQNNVLTPDLQNPGFAVQTSSIKASGAELEVKTTHLFGFNTAAAYTYLDPRVTRTNVAGGVGKAPVGMAKHQASLWTTYTFQPEGVLGGLTLGGGIRFVDSSFANALNTVAIPSFTLLDLTAQYRLGALSATLSNWDVALSVKNVADKRYVASCDDVSQCYFGLGRTINGTLRARF